MTPQTQELILELLRRQQKQIDWLQREVHGDEGVKERLAALEADTEALRCVLDDITARAVERRGRWLGLVFKVLGGVILAVLGYLSSQYLKAEEVYGTQTYRVPVLESASDGWWVVRIEELVFPVKDGTPILCVKDDYAFTELSTPNTVYGCLMQKGSMVKEQKYYRKGDSLDVGI